MKRIDLSGRKKGRITVISYSHSHTQPSGQKRAMWNAICDCGNNFKISTGTFSQKGNISCGCYIQELRHKGMRKRTPLSDLKAFYVVYKCRAKTIQKEFSISFEEFSILVTNNCYFCNGEPSQRNTKIGRKRKVKYSGIDRLDNKSGYVISNCVPCCAKCNMMKNELSTDDFKSHIQSIYNFYIRKN